MGLFNVTVGVMGSSKSSRAIADVKNLRFEGHRVLVIKPKQDDRDGDEISSRLIAESIKADMVLYPGEDINKQHIIESNYDCIVADEIHMFDVKVIEDLYEITAVSDTDVHLYGLAMSWKGKPFMTTAIAMAYADEIDRIKTTDKQKNLLTHHIKKVGNMPCDITQEDGEIETGDLGQGKYFTVSKQTFYNLYGMLGQIDKQEEDESIIEELIAHKLGGPEAIYRTVTPCNSLLGKAYPMVGQSIRLNDKGISKLYTRGDIFLNLFTIKEIEDDKYRINLYNEVIRHTYIDIEDFNILIDHDEFIPFICDANHDSQGRYCYVDINM